ncbi:hypothetical protein fHyEco03_gp18 [Escherichia phage vB_EcoM_fHy-Eco03]|nr:hypothetical protein fHyEco03_gp18 [Escherichia phage vB_EcoM_fHy-Eco03]
MARKPQKTRDATAELLASMNRIQLDPLEVIARAIKLAEADSDYKTMIDGSLGIMPYMYPKLKESVVKADIDQTISGGGVNLNITVGGKKIVGEEPEEEPEDEDNNES